ncbi:MAG: hypothetical protein HZA52_20240 [Planctomycetes bacterium]|nr:hypothetical protein [Planctomycetota bacterium]
MAASAWSLALCIGAASACSGVVLEERDHGEWMPTLRVELPIERPAADAPELSQHVELAASAVNGSVDALDYEFGELQASWSWCRAFENGARGVGRFGVGYASYDLEWSGSRPTEFDIRGLSLPVGAALELPFGGDFEFELRGQLALVLGEDLAQSSQLEAGFGWNVAAGVTLLVGWRRWVLEASALDDPVFTDVDLEVDGPMFALRLRR